MQKDGVIKAGKAERVFPQLRSQEEIDGRAPPVPARRVQYTPSAPLKKAPETPAPGPRANPPAPPIEATTLSVRNLHDHGDLYYRYLRARRDVFIVQKGWQLPETDGMEFDQYDTPLARWIAIHRDGQMLGGARVSPTTAMCGNHSYMLRDAQLGLVSSLPQDILYEKAPVQNDIWEATRLFVMDTVPSELRSEVQAALMREMCAAARREGATQIIGIVPAIFRRWLKRIGMTAEAVGPMKNIDGDNVQAALLDVRENAGSQSLIRLAEPRHTPAHEPQRPPVGDSEGELASRPGKPLSRLRRFRTRPSWDRKAS